MRIIYNDKYLGVTDGINSKKEGYVNNQEEYESSYLLGVRIAAGCAGLTVKEANVIKMLGGFIISDEKKNTLNIDYVKCLSELRDIESAFVLADMGGATEAI